MAVADEINVGDKVHVEFDGEVVDKLGTTACRVEYLAAGRKYTVLIAVDQLEPS